MYSMTGYATDSIKLDSLEIQMDIKSVNHRFFDLAFRIPENFRPLEPDIRKIIMDNISRGRVDFRIIVKENEQNNSQQLALNHQKLLSYLDIYQQVKVLQPNLLDSSVMDILSVPNMIINKSIVEVEVEELQGKIMANVAQLCGDLKLSQETEGTRLSQIILDKINKIKLITKESQQIIAEITQNYKTKLKQKLLESFEESIINDSRFQQEFVYFCQKIDIDEELTRLLSHTNQFSILMQKGGIVGKRLDFITQEMVREANTFGAKSISIKTTELAVELKVLIEQIKEQIQNIM